jgi:hypothetical protein
MRSRFWLLGLILLMAIQLAGCGLFTRPDSPGGSNIIHARGIVNATSVPLVLQCADCGIVSTSLTRQDTWSKHVGTSFATPHVSAAAGMLKAQGYTAEQVKQRLIETARPLGIGPGDMHYGAGLLDVAAALGQQTRATLSVTETIQKMQSTPARTLVTPSLEPLATSIPEYNLVMQVIPGSETELQQLLIKKGYNISQMQYVWAVTGGSELYALADELTKSAYVESVMVHQTLYSMGVPVNDLLFSQQWALPYSAFTTAWEMPVNVDLDQITIAVLDSGVDFGHDDLQGVVWEAPCTMLQGLHSLYPANYKMEPPEVAFLKPAQTYCWNDVPEDKTHGHGTAVTGIIAAVRNNLIGISGAGYGADGKTFKIMPVKVINDIGGGTSATVAYGVYYAVAMGADVINMSLGLRPGTALDADLASAFAYAAENDVVVVVAAGNDGMSILSPMASVPSVISVGATSIWGTRASYSNYGVGLDLVAPGGARRDDYTTMVLASSSRPESSLIRVLGYTLAKVGVRFELPVLMSTPTPIYYYAWLDTDLDGSLNYGDYYDVVGPVLPFMNSMTMVLNLQLYEGPERALVLEANITN